MDFTFNSSDSPISFSCPKEDADFTFAVPEGVVAVKLEAKRRLTGKSDCMEVSANIDRWDRDVDLAIGFRTGPGQYIYYRIQALEKETTYTIIFQPAK